MYKKENCDLQIDLVFKCNNFSKLSNNFLNKTDNLIFESGYWEEVLLCWIKIILNEKDKISILIPPMFLNSWLCLSKDCIYSYEYSFKEDYNDVNNQISIKWNDERINYNWPIKKPILSIRDK